MKERKRRKRGEKGSEWKRTGIRSSIRTQFSMIFIGLMAGVVILCILLNGLFLPQFYTRAKTNMIKKAYTELLQSENATALDTEALQQELDRLALNYNISVLIIGSDSQLIYSSVQGMHGMDMVQNRLFRYLFDMENGGEKSQLLEQTEKYVLRRSEGPDGGDLEMIGTLNNDASFIMWTPMESIRESARYATRFFMLIGLLGTLLGGVIIWYVTRFVTKPILQLNDISTRMVNLDFDAKYQGRSRNEIGLLGENMNKLSDSLEHSISDLKTANNELRRDIEKKEKLDEMRQEFIGSVSHELKTPLALIQGYAEGLKEGINDDAGSRDFYCDVIMDEASKMNHMVQSLLSLNQLECGDEVINLQRFDILEMIRNYLSSARLLAEQDGVKVLFDAQGVQNVWGDEYKAEEVFTNYFSNAVHYCSETPSGEKYIRVDLTPHDDVLRISVFNTGEKIPEESLDRIWEKFYKVDKARTRTYGGSGVGLSIVKAIQESLDQGYGVINHEDGVEFWYELALK